MRGLCFLISVLLSTQVFAEEVSCRAFALGAGLDNVGVYSNSTKLSKSPSGEALLGTLVYEFPEAVPIENKKIKGAKDVYKLEVSVKLQEGTSKWSAGAPSINASATLTKKGKFVTYREFDSNTLYNPSDKRIVDSGKVLGANIILLSPLAVQQVSRMNNEQLNVLGVDISVKDLVRELGFQNAAAHLADQKKIEHHLLTGVQINCTH